MSPRHSDSSIAAAGIIIFLVVSILAVYWQVGSHDFVAFDDESYLLENPVVRSGLTLNGISWAFTSLYAGNWHPLTWISHMLDVQLFGMNAAGHHLMSVALHAANSILLFLLLCRMTGSLLRSVVVAALFALHPLHVESVAWAAERKDVLSALFWMLTLYLYAGYVKKPGRSRYILVLATFALGLMAKPMLVTLPFIMLLLDYWPLGRFEAWQREESRSSPGARRRSFAYLVQEKIPFLLLVTASCIVTVYAQHRGNAITSLAITSLLKRTTNAFIAYTNYLGKTFWPRDLAVFYPFHKAPQSWPALCCAALLTAITVIAIQERRRRPYLITGWLWYIVTLVPVIGIVQVGLQSMADRYTYIPLTGIFVMVVWGVAGISEKWPCRRVLIGGLTATVLIACSIATWRQAACWKNSATLAIHALASTRDNFIAHSILGHQLVKDGKFVEAINHYEETASIEPMYAPVYLNIGDVYEKLGRVDESINNYETSLLINPAQTNIHYIIGSSLYSKGKRDEAIQHYYKELDVNPNFVDCHNNLGIALADRGDLDDAIRHFTYALKLEPDYYQAQKNMERVLTLRRTR